MLTLEEGGEGGRREARADSVPGGLWVRDPRSPEVCSLTQGPEASLEHSCD